MNGYFWTVKLAMRWYPHQIEGGCISRSHIRSTAPFLTVAADIIRTKVILFKFKCSRTSRGVPVMPDIMAAVKCCCYPVKVDVYF